MSNAPSHSWTWTFRLLTAATVCLLPVSCDAAGGETDDPDLSDASNDPCIATGVSDVAAVLVDDDHREYVGRTPGASSCFTWPALPSAEPTPPPARSQILHAPGPSIHLIAPTHSPPVSPTSVS